VLVSVCLLAMSHMLLVSCRTDLRLISLDLPYFADVVLPIRPYLENAIAADLDPLTGRKLRTTAIDSSIVWSFVSLSCGFAVQKRVQHPVGLVTLREVGVLIAVTDSMWLSSYYFGQLLVLMSN